MAMNGIINCKSTIQYVTSITSSDQRFSGTIRSTVSIGMSHGKCLFTLVINSDRFVSNIDVPFLVLQAKDDPICTVNTMPMNDLLKNPNCFVIKLKHGGHCDFFTKIPGSSKSHRVSRFIDY